MNQTKCMFFRHNRTTVSQPTLNGSSRGAFDFTTMNQTKVNKSPQISTGLPFVAPPSKRPLGPSEEFTLLILTTLAAGLKVFKRVVASLNSPVTLSGVASPRFPISGPNQAASLQWQHRQVFFSGLLFSSIFAPTLPDFSRPFRGITLRVGPAAFKGHSRLE